MLKKIFLLIFFSILITNCNYSPVYVKNENFKYSINFTKIIGDNEINRYIIKDLNQQSKAEAENCKVSIRSARKDANDEVKSLGKDGLPEDSVKDAEDAVQKLTDRYITNVDSVLKEKETDIMKV